MAQGDRMAAAAAAAAAVIDLDEGTSGASQELLAAVLIARGRTEEARARLEAARDAAERHRAALAPLPGRSADVLRGKSAEHGSRASGPPACLRARPGRRAARPAVVPATTATSPRGHTPGHGRWRRLRRPARSRRVVRAAPTPSSGRRSGRALPWPRSTARALRADGRGPSVPSHARVTLWRSPASRRSCAPTSISSRPGREVDERVVRQSCPHIPAIGRYPVRLPIHASWRSWPTSRCHQEAMVSSPRGGRACRAARRQQRWRSRTDRERSTCCGRPRRATTRSASAAPTPWAGARLRAGRSRPRAWFFLTRAAGGTGVLPADLPVAQRPRRGDRRHRRRAEVRLAVEERWKTFEFELRAPEGLSRITLDWAAAATAGRFTSNARRAVWSAEGTRTSSLARRGARVPSVRGSRASGTPALGRAEQAERECLILSVHWRSTRAGLLA